MRVKGGSTLDETFASLTKAQQKKVESVEALRSKEDEAVRAVLHRSRDAIRKALEADVPARLLAGRMGISAARVYQLRDQAIAYNAERESAKS